MCEKKPHRLPDSRSRGTSCCNVTHSRARWNERPRATAETTDGGRGQLALGDRTWWWRFDIHPLSNARLTQLDDLLGCNARHTPLAVATGGGVNIQGGQTLISLLFECDTPRWIATRTWLWLPQTADDEEPPEKEFSLPCSTDKWCSKKWLEINKIQIYLRDVRNNPEPK